VQPTTGTERITDWLRAAGAERPAPVVDAATLDDLREGLDLLARAAAARVPAHLRPLRLTKATIDALLRCPRAGAARLAAADEGPHSGPLLVGALFEQVAHLIVERIVDPEADGPAGTFDRACAALAVASGEDVDHLVGDDARDLLEEQLFERVRRFRSSWRAPLHPAWWYRSEVPFEVAFGDGAAGPAAVLACRVDLSFGPTPPALGSGGRPRLLLELKSGRHDVAHLDDLGLYLLAAALVEGSAPVGGAVWWAAPSTPAPHGVLQTLRADAPTLQSAAVRVGRALEVAADVLGGRVATIPGGHCRFCPDRTVCPAAASSDEFGDAW